MNIEQFEIFRTIAQVRSFTRAAKLLNFTQPAISTQIKLLEKYYNVELFERGSGGVKLTEAGRKFYEYGEKILELFAEMERELARISGSSREVIKLGATYSPGNYFLPSAIRFFKTQNPDAYIRLNIAQSEEIIEALRERSLDIGVIEGDISSTLDIERHKVSANKLVLVAPNNRRWREVENINIEELRKEPFITREEESSLRYFFNSYLKSVGYDLSNLNIVMEITSWEGMKQAVLNNIGLAIIPYPVVEREIKEGRLKELKLEGEDIRFSWDTEVIVRKGESLNGLKKAFLDFLLSPSMVWTSEGEYIEKNKMLFI